MNEMKKVFTFIFLTVGLLLSLFTGCKDKKDQNGSLVMYCAVGLKPGAERITRDYEDAYGVRIGIQYGGSGSLLSSIRVTKTGDLYLAADDSYIDKAKSWDLIEEVQPIAFLMPVIAVAKGNPLNIQSVKDLTRKDVKLSLANPESAAIGRMTKIMLEQSGDWEAISKHTKVMKPTVNGICNDIKLGAVDAGIVWRSVAAMYNELESVNVPEWNQFKRPVSMGVLKGSKNPTEALKFMRYFSARDKGLKIFNSMGYETVVGDMWEEKPSILFYSGGVNRVAVENTIRAFEKREGVEVTRVYNGCGILVAQIKAGQKPDAYLTCDVSFMNQVKSEFQDINTISATKIVIATAKGNDKNISNLNDLTRPGLKIGVCNPQQSALGTLTKRMLQQMGLWEGIFKNVVSQTPTADLLVNQLRVGGLDAAIVYQANTSQVADKINVVPIEMDHAIAVQDMGININSDHKYLSKRLFAALTSEESMTNYLENGFTWEYIE